MKKTKVLLLELNEFSMDVLSGAVEKLPLKNIEKLLSFHSITTHTSDTYESDYLEPWVQWVSVHTGTPSSKHQIKHLGDVPHLDNHQLWEELSEMGVSSGVWGAMNASKASAKNTKFFLPDPWTHTEDAFPASLNVLLDPIRHVSKNYLNRSNSYLLKKLMGIIHLIFKNGLGATFFKELPRLLTNAIRFKGKSFVFISFFDYLSTMLFLEFKKREKPEFTLLFLNSLAHLQHHHWKELDPVKNPPLKYGLVYIDRILGKIFAATEENEEILVTNALSQKNTFEDEPWILYRQNDQAKFLQTIGISFEKVEPLMTHDAHIHFKTEEEMMRAKKILESVSVEGKPFFLIEDYPQDRKKLFYRILFTDRLENGAQLVVGKRKYPFFKLFTPIVQRTGKHIPQGTLFSNKGFTVDKLQNHEIYDYIKACYE